MCLHTYNVQNVLCIIKILDICKEHSGYWVAEKRRAGDEETKKEFSQIFIIIKDMAFHISNSLIVFSTYLVVAGMIFFVCFQPASGQEFIEGPKGDLCVLNPAGGGDTYYDYYSNGTNLRCELCHIGKVLVSHCTSTANTICRLLTPDDGQIMPQPNFCTSGFLCKTCPGPSLTVKKLCDYKAMDTECECAVGYYPVNFEADKCLPLPRCNKGFEPRRPGDGTEVGAEMICQNCRDGFYQPNDNSTDLCTMFTNCIETPGTDVSDNVCKGDSQSSGLPATSPTENAASVFLTTPSTRVSIGPTSPTLDETTDSPNQTGPTSPTLEGTTDSLNQTGGHLSDNATDPTVDHDNNLTYNKLQVILFGSLSGIFYLLGFGSGKLHDYWKKNGRCPCTKAPIEEHELDQRGSTSGSAVVNIPSSDEDVAEEPCVTTDLTSKKGRRDLLRKIKLRGGKRR